VRLEELVLHIPGDEFRISFHRELTVLHGLSLLERQALVDSLIGALTGEADSTTLTYTDESGRRIRLVSGGGHSSMTYIDDGSPAPSLIRGSSRDAEAIREAMVVQAGDLGLSTAVRADEPPELTEARATLAGLTDQLKQALAVQQRVDAITAELNEVAAAMRVADDNAARREYARALADLEKVRAEAAALQSGSTGVEADRHLLSAADTARELAGRWSSSNERLQGLLERIGDRDRLDEATIAMASSIPAEVPADLGKRVGKLRRVKAEHDELEGRLRDLAVARLPEPSEPLVADLARVNQRALWEVHGRLAAATATLHEEELALGGLTSEGPPPTQVDDIEAAHVQVVEAEQLVEERRTHALAAGGACAVVLAASAMAVVPLLAVAPAAGAIATWLFLVRAPQKRLSAALAEEARALEPTGASTYLAFHLRRVDAVIDPAARESLELAMVEHRLARQAWIEAVGDIDADQAARLREEISEYADAIASLGDAAGEIEALRDDLKSRAAPALAKAQADLASVCGRYLVDEAPLSSGDLAEVEAMVREQVALGHAARAQELLGQAEAEEHKLGTQLDEMLLQLGFREGTLDARVGALEWAIGRASEREEARARARDREAIENDLVRLQDDVRRLRRPEWATVTAAEANEPDIDELAARKAELEKELATVRPEDADPDLGVDRVADRHSAMERRVAALEAQHEGIDPEAVGALADVQQYLFAHLTQAAHAGPADDAVPVVLDEVFARIPAERKWELLDMVLRLGEKTQLIYLTDDPYVGAWARRHAPDGTLMLLEPLPA
jgi:hypothetical protein